MRFSPEVARERHKYAWVPFGGGAHMCLGLHFAYMPAKIFFHHVITTPRIHVPDCYAPEWQVLPVPRPKAGLPVSLVPLCPGEVGRSGGGEGDVPKLPVPK